MVVLLRGKIGEKVRKVRMGKRKLGIPITSGANL
jgi:hypothetical protein